MSLFTLVIIIIDFFNEIIVTLAVLNMPDISPNQNLLTVDPDFHCKKVVATISQPLFHFSSTG